MKGVLSDLASDGSNLKQKIERLQKAVNSREFNEDLRKTWLRLNLASMTPLRKDGSIPSGPEELEVRKEAWKELMSTPVVTETWTADGDVLPAGEFTKSTDCVYVVAWAGYYTGVGGNAKACVKDAAGNQYCGSLRSLGTSVTSYFDSE